MDGNQVLTDTESSDNVSQDLKSNTFDNLFSKKDDSHHGIVICGHRGGCGKSEPENTLRAFKKALDMGLKCIEYDIWLTLDD